MTISEPAEPPKRLRRRQTAAATMRRRLSRLDIPIQPPDAPVAPPPAAGRTTQLTPLSSLESMALGVLAGTIETIVVQPMIFCKNMIQQSLPLSADPRLLFRGLGVNICSMAILTGLQFPLTHALQGAVTGHTRETTSAEKVATALVGGAISGFVCAPMEMLMIQQQRYGGSLFFTAAQVWKGYGVAGLFRGLSTSCGREGCYTAGYLGVAPIIRQSLQERFGMSPNAATVTGAVTAGILAGTASHPFDTVKTCMQGDLQRKEYGTLSETTALLWRQAGPRALMRGLVWRNAFAICGVFILGEVGERMPPHLFPHRYDFAVSFG